MYPVHQLVEVGPGQRRGVKILGVVAQPLKSAAGDQQLAVESFVPVPGQPDFGKGGIERGAMPVALGVGKRTIDIKN